MLILIQRLTLIPVLLSLMACIEIPPQPRDSLSPSVAPSTNIQETAPPINSPSPSTITPSPIIGTAKPILASPIPVKINLDRDRTEVLFIGIVHGRVFNPDTGLGMADTEVFVDQGSSIARAMTDSQGKFSIEKLATNRDLELASTFIKSMPFRLNNNLPKIELDLNVDCGFAKNEWSGIYKKVPVSGKVQDSLGNSITNEKRVRLSYLEPSPPSNYPCKFDQNEVTETMTTLGGTFGFSFVPQDIPIKLTVLDNDDGVLLEISTETKIQSLWTNSHILKIDTDKDSASPSPIPSPSPTPKPSLTATDGSSVTQIEGLIYSESNQLLNDATISIRSLSESRPFQETTHTVEGSYTFNTVPVGVQLEITISKDGYLTQTRTYTISENSAQRLNFGHNGDPNDEGSDDNALKRVESSSI